MHSKFNAFRRDGGFPFAIRRHLPGVLAVRIIGASDKRAKLAELQRKLPISAGRAFPRAAAIRRRRENVRRENFIQRIQHMGNAQVLDLAHMGGKIFPEIAQHFAPVDFAVGNAVELLFEICREAILHILG